ncbi:ATP-binding cassette domain-containing protein [Streptomyces sp. NPDC088116]|uniref:ATP-binding cassette domain-containing protein n=1 Tax=Streptomyces sp. NPDC088116 TaxID=3365825 RepID=UPI00380B8FAE
MTAGPPLLAADGLRKAYGPTAALDGASFSIRPGEIVAVMGASGSGKSTLLHCLAGIVTPDSGTITYRGRPLTAMSDAERSALRRTEFGFVFQFGQLVPELTCAENVALPLRLTGVRRKDAERTALDWMERLEVDGIGSKRPGEVSGGQGQRGAVARSLVASPRLVFADEPTGALDSLNGERVMELFTEAGRRRLWWRLLMPLIGIALLMATRTVTEETEAVGRYTIAGGAVLVLVGLTALLPWAVEAAVVRLRGGPVAWQLATRRLQLGSGSAARTVSGITVVVAGAIALQMMFGGMHEGFVKPTGQDPTRANITVSASFGNGELAQRMIDDFRATKGVRKVIGTVESYVVAPGPVPDGGIRPTTTLTVGTCATLRELARLPSCADGDAFVSHIPGDKRMSDWVDETARPGRPVDLNTRSVDDGSKPVLWTLPASAHTVQARTDPLGRETDGIFATPGAIDPSRLTSATTTATIRVDDGVPDAVEHVRNTAAGLDPSMRVTTVERVERDKQYASVRTGLMIGGTATMGLIAASMLVSQIEQLRERRRLLSVLVAFGTRRATLAWSVLWQTAVPVVVGTALAIAGGLALGAVLLDMIAKPVSGWWGFVPYASAGAGVILLVTVLSMPPLWRMMRPEVLRTE